MTTTTAISIVQTSTHTLQWTIRNSAGQITDISGYTAALRLSKDSETPVAEFDGDCASFGADGNVVFKLLDADTNIDKGVYIYQVWLLISAIESEVVAQGNLTITAAIARL